MFLEECLASFKMYEDSKEYIYIYIYIYMFCEIWCL